jgi:hypothetical protein
MSHHQVYVALRQLPLCGAQVATTASTCTSYSINLTEHKCFAEHVLCDMYFMGWAMRPAHITPPSLHPPTWSVLFISRLSAPRHSVMILMIQTGQGRR